MNIKNEKGVAIVEFAFVIVIFFTLLLGIMDFGRLLFLWNSATESTRIGARTAIVCDLGDSAVENKMTQIFPQATGKVQVDWNPVGCTTANCQGVTVSINDDGTIFEPISPWLGFTTITMPTFSTYLPRESMDSLNPDCS